MTSYCPTMQLPCSFAPHRAATGRKGLPLVGRVRKPSTSVSDTEKDLLGLGEKEMYGDYQGPIGNRGIHTGMGK